MGSQTIFTAIPFLRSDDGFLLSGEAKTFASADMAAKQAELFGRSFQGAVALSRVDDIESGECEPAEIIKQVGDVPNLDYLLGY